MFQKNVLNGIAYRIGKDYIKQGRNFRFNCKEVTTSGLNMINSSSCLYSQRIIIQRDGRRISFTFKYCFLYVKLYFFLTVLRSIVIVRSVGGASGADGLISHVVIKPRALAAKLNCTLGLACFDQPI